MFIVYQLFCIVYSILGLLTSYGDTAGLSYKTLLIPTSLYVDSYWHHLRILNDGLPPRGDPALTPPGLFHSSKNDFVYFYIFCARFSKHSGFLNKIDRVLILIKIEVSWFFFTFLFVFQNLTDSVIKLIVCWWFSRKCNFCWFWCFCSFLKHQEFLNKINQCLIILTKLNFSWFFINFWVFSKL